jgi:hypothetical protein
MISQRIVLFGMLVLAAASPARAEGPSLAPVDQSVRAARFLDVFDQACLHTKLEVEPMETVMARFQVRKYQSNLVTKSNQPGETIADIWMMGAPYDITLVLMRETRPQTSGAGSHTCSLEMQGPDDLDIPESVERMIKKYAADAPGNLNVLIPPPSNDRPISGKIFLLPPVMGGAAAVSKEKRGESEVIYRANMRLVND